MLLHFLIVLLDLPDLAALLLFAVPVIVFIAYCTNNSTHRMLRSALVIYASFAAVLVSSALMVHLID